MKTERGYISPFRAVFIALLISTVLCVGGAWLTGHDILSRGPHWGGILFSIFCIGIVVWGIIAVMMLPNWSE